MKIANRISLSFLAITLLISVISFSVFYAITRSSLKTEIVAHLQTTARSRQAHIETYLTMLESSLGQLSKSAVLEDYLKRRAADPKNIESFKTALNSLIRIKEASPTIQEYLLMDLSGQVIVSSNQGSIGQDKSTDTLFLGGQKGVYIKDAFYSEALKAPTIAVSDAIVDSTTGELLGVIAARVRLEDLNKIVTDRTGLGKFGEIIIVNKYGFMITPSRFLNDTFLKKKVDSKNFRMALMPHATKDAEEPVIIAPDEREVIVLGTRAYISKLGWVLLAEFDYDEEFAPLVKLQWLFLLIFFFTIISTWLLGTFIAKALTQPIHRLHRGTEIIGSGNLDYTVGTPAKDEIGQLSRAFDSMSQELKKTTVSIDILNREIAERKKTEEELRVSEAKFRTIYEGSNDAVMLLTEKGFFDCNPCTLKMFGFKSKDEFTRVHPADISPPTQPDGRESFPAAMECIQTAFQQGSNRFEWIHRRTNGEDFPAEVLLSAFDFGGKQVLQAIVRDITERISLQQKLQEIATHDSLTGLPNRILLYDRLSVAIVRAQRKSKQLAVMLLDLDGFKAVNDSLGHDIGDKLLIAIANLLTSMLRKSDTVARLGGDEFVLLLFEIGQIDNAVKVAQKIIEGFRQQFVVNGHKLQITVSIGIAIFPEDGRDIEDLIKNADKAMYHAKESGRNTYKLCVDNDNT